MVREGRKVGDAQQWGCLPGNETKDQWFLLILQSTVLCRLRLMGITYYCCMLRPDTCGDSHDQGIVVVVADGAYQVGTIRKPPKTSWTSDIFTPNEQLVLHAWIFDSMNPIFISIIGGFFFAHTKHVQHMALSLSPEVVVGDVIPINFSLIWLLPINHRRTVT